MARYTAKLIAALKHAYEETERPVDLIATDFDVSSRNIQRLVVTENWKSRRVRKHKPREVPVALELLAQAQALNKELPPSPPLAEGWEQKSALDRLEALVLREIEAEEQGRNDSRGRRIGDGERRARALATLTQTLRTIHFMRNGVSPEQEIANDDSARDDATDDYDIARQDLPRDLDEFRRDLARRIDAFVASRTDGGDADGPAAGAAVAEV